MCKGRYDITYTDLNPTVLFINKRTMSQNSSYHDHDFAEITYILSGKGKYLVEGKSYDVQAGDLIVCNPGVYHHNVVIDPEAPTIEFFAGFTDFQFKDMPQNSIILEEGSYIMHTDTELKQRLSKLCYSMLAENESPHVGKYFMLKSYLIQFLLLIIRQNSEPNPNLDGRNFESHYKGYVVSQIIDYLDENYNEKVSLDRIARNMYLSPVYISKIFKEETGESPINYLIKIRLEKAKDMLETSDSESIKKIANTVGYDDAYHFSKLFKKYYGISPSHYRNKLS
ncbi:MAG: helix-turn-helix transcriptional regulator [Clostridiales bacterium]|nr:helix-turn-helix transcriptional regulator [Clostridiales bacterium]